MPEVKPWKGVCCSRCYIAKSEKKKCKCRCHGTYHGEGLKKRIEKTENEKQEDKQ